eukprot:scaffold1912_cov167-Amphora_coffeaeformis.AAC.37
MMIRHYFARRNAVAHKIRAAKRARVGKRQTALSINIAIWCCGRDYSVLVKNLSCVRSLTALRKQAHTKTTTRKPLLQDEDSQ